MIEENRKKKQIDAMKSKSADNGCVHDLMTDTDKHLINEIGQAYDQTNVAAPSKVLLSNHRFLSFLIL